MLYMVECGFTDPARLAAWNEWYSGPKLASLLALPGWMASQRFLALDDVPAPWLGVHSVPGPEFFQSAVYKNAGGGNFADWGPLITNWSRNLFDGLVRAPEVAEGELLALADVPPGRQPLPDVEFAWLRGVGLDKRVPSRGIAVLKAAPAAVPAEVRLYRPFTPPLRGQG